MNCQGKVWFANKRRDISLSQYCQSKIFSKLSSSARVMSLSELCQGRTHCFFSHPSLQIVATLQQWSLYSNQREALLPIVHSFLLRGRGRQGAGGGVEPPARPLSGTDQCCRFFAYNERRGTDGGNFSSCSSVSAKRFDVKNEVGQGDRGINGGDPHSWGETVYAAKAP